MHAALPLLSCPPVAYPPMATASHCWPIWSPYTFFIIFLLCLVFLLPCPLPPLLLFLPSPFLVPWYTPTNCVIMDWTHFGLAIDRHEFGTWNSKRKKKNKRLLCLFKISSSKTKMKDIFRCWISWSNLAITCIGMFRLILHHNYTKKSGYQEWSIFNSSTTFLIRKAISLYPL